MVAIKLSAGLLITLASTTLASGALISETIIIPSDGSSVSTSDVLGVGLEYEVVISGLYRFDVGEPGEFADAQFREDDNNVFSIRYNSVEFNGVRLNADVMDLPNHVHTYFITGAGSDLTLRMFDNFYDDNQGFLTAQISASVPEPASIAVWSAVSALGLLSYTRGVRHRRRTRSD